MSEEAEIAGAVDPTPAAASSSAEDSLSKSQSALESLAAIIDSVPPSLASSANPALSLLRDPAASTGIAALLASPASGSGDDSICRWLYDAFHSGDPGLRLVVLRYVPLLAGAYLSRASLRHPLPGFEAVLLALYASETASRAGEPITVALPDLSQPSIYHETTSPSLKTVPTPPSPTVVSPALEPYGTVRSTRRAKIVGVALELYYGKINEMPKDSKLEFCHVCKVWAGNQDQRSEQEGERRTIPLPWELLQPMLRILGHFIGAYWANDKEVSDAAKEACKSLHVRAVHDINSKAILGTESLLRLGNMSLETCGVVDHPIPLLATQTSATNNDVVTP